MLAQLLAEKIAQAIATVDVKKVAPEVVILLPKVAIVIGGVMVVARMAVIRVVIQAAQNLAKVGAAVNAHGVATLLVKTIVPELVQEGAPTLAQELVKILVKMVVAVIVVADVAEVV